MGYSLLNFSRFLTRLQRFTLPAGLSSMPLYSAGFGLLVAEVGIEPTKASL